MNPPTLHTLLVAAAVTTVTAGLAFAVIQLSGDPDREVSAFEVGSLSAPTTPTSQPSSTSVDRTRPVAALDTLQGTFERFGDDDDYTVDGIEVDFGPDNWVALADSPEDLDGDGQLEALRVELQGLVGRNVDLEVQFDHDGDEADVYTVNGVTVRDPAGPAPWSVADGAPLLDRNAIAAAAEVAIGGGAQAIELDRKDEPGGPVWEVDVVDAEGREHTVLLNAAGDELGQALDDDPDDGDDD